MGVAHWLGVHWGPHTEFRMWDQGDTVEDKVLTYLRAFPKDHTMGPFNTHIGIYDTITMRRRNRFRVVNFGDLCRVFRRIRKLERTENAVLLLQTGEVEKGKDADNHRISHEIGYTWPVTKGLLSEALASTLGGIMTTQASAPRVCKYLETGADPFPVYYFPEPIVQEYRWNYEI